MSSIFTLLKPISDPLETIDLYIKSRCARALSPPKLVRPSRKISLPGRCITDRSIDLNRRLLSSDPPSRCTRNKEGLSHDSESVDRLEPYMVSCYTIERVLLLFLALSRDLGANFVRRVVADEGVFD